MTVLDLFIDELELISEFKNAPNVQIELEWDGGEGRYYCEEYEFEFGRHLVRFELRVTQQCKTAPATYLQPAEYCYSDLEITIDLKEVWVNDDEVSIFPTLHKELTQILKTKIEGYGIE